MVVFGAEGGLCRWELRDAPGGCGSDGGGGGGGAAAAAAASTISCESSARVCLCAEGCKVSLKPAFRGPWLQNGTKMWLEIVVYTIQVPQNRSSVQNDH